MRFRHRPQIIKPRAKVGDDRVSSTDAGQQHHNGLTTSLTALDVVLAAGVELKFSAGGGPAPSLAPYGKVRASIGITNGSAFGAPLARCRRADLVIKGGGGLGLALGTTATTAITAITKLIPGLPPFKADLEAELMGTIIDRSQTVPEVPLCTA
ncbi:hypothetical protein SK571_33755 [Lentzea sp. BCCO 10_0798]|uniref:Uncharacterized protein n=1 Tax=Lentzea kristufekii TaxID=3095430 RepID=A0ABU4U1B4_9PSEU|nr:hypothetical protein [Lentzea sp. BCCO 10_0798]MDX8054363.1 hypothetical protein [Lentzea sp. BCCO 10_0798]